MEYQFKRVLSETLIGESQNLLVGNSLIEYWQQINIREILFQAGTDMAGSIFYFSICIEQQLSILKIRREPTGRQNACRNKSANATPHSYEK